MTITCNSVIWQMYDTMLHHTTTYDSYICHTNPNSKSKNKKRNKNK